MDLIIQIALKKTISHLFVKNIKEKMKIFYVGDRKKSSFTMVLEKVSHVENNIFDQNFATDCDIDTNIYIFFKHVLFNCYFISISIGMYKKKICLLF